MAGNWSKRYSSLNIRIFLQVGIKDKNYKKANITSTTAITISTNRNY